mgnify:CR=1 FL=1
MDKTDFTRFLTVYRHYTEGKKVDSIEFKLSVQDMINGSIHVTDLQLQDGQQVTGQTYNTKAIMGNERFTIDETYNEVGGYENIYQGDQPQVFSDMKQRFFNLVGRGFETVAVPNVFHEDFRKELLTTGLDLTLWPKNDYDFLRISTFYGGQLEDRDRTYQDDRLIDNPLNTRYTREFCFNGGQVGDEIKLLASQQQALKNGQQVPLGVQQFHVGHETDFSGQQERYYQNRQRFMALPIGSTRINIQFMKRVNDGDLEYMIDDGIGFHGLAEFTQWSWGNSKL